jgi:hypothetical protein
MTDEFKCYVSNAGGEDADPLSNVQKGWVSEKVLQYDVKSSVADPDSGSGIRDPGLGAF